MSSNQAPAPLTPLTKDGPPAAPFTRGQIIRRMLSALLIWLVANLVVFVGVSFLVFVLLSSLGPIQGDEAFTLAVLCAIPAALTASGLLAGRKIYFTLAKREH